MLIAVGLWSGCGDDNTTGPQGQTLNVETEKWDNGNIKVEYQYYRDGGEVVRHGWYKEYYEDGNISSKTIKLDNGGVEKINYTKS